MHCSAKSESDIARFQKRLLAGTAGTKLNNGKYKTHVDMIQRCASPYSCDHLGDGVNTEKFVTHDHSDALGVYPICILSSAINLGVAAEGGGVRGGGARDTNQIVQLHLSIRSVYVSGCPNQRTCICRG